MTEKNNNRNGLTMSTHLRSDLQASEWITQAEAARLRGVSRQAIARLVKKGRFQLLRVGGRVFLRVSDVQKFKAELPGRPPKDDSKGR